MLDDKGYKRPIYSEIVEKYENRAKIVFGHDVDTGDAAPIGQFIRLIAYDTSEVHELAEKIYYSASVSTASGQSLDRLVPSAGVSRNPATCAIHKVKLIGTPGYKIDPGFLVSKSGLPFYVTEDCILNTQGEGFTDVRCTKSGAIGNVATIDTIVNPNGDVTKVSYVSQIEQGLEIESDTELRERFFKAQKGSGSQTESSIEGAVAKVPGVRAVSAIENDSNVEVNGLPPHSFHVFVSGGSDSDIAHAILSKKPAGIPTHGMVSQTVLDNSGKEVLIKFSRIADLIIKIKLTVTVDKFFKQDGMDQIKSNLVGKFNNLKSGEDLMYSSLFGPIHSVEGVVSVTNLVVSQDGGTTYSNNDIAVDESKRVEVSLSNIEVTTIWT